MLCPAETPLLYCCEPERVYTASGDVSSPPCNYCCCAVSLCDAANATLLGATSMCCTAARDLVSQRQGENAKAPFTCAVSTLPPLKVIPLTLTYK